MDNVSKKLKIKISIVLISVFSLFLLSIVSSLAGASGVYIANTRASYAHPLTGKIEDSGNNSGLGQGMSESILHKQALIEIDSLGDTFATVRFSMMDNISKVKFFVQKDAESEFEQINCNITKEGENTTDFRFKIDNEKAIVKSVFFVEPMGRDVTFFLEFSDLTAGNGDFRVSVDPNKPATSESQTQTPSETKKENKPTNLPLIIFEVAVVISILAVAVVFFMTRKKK